MDGWSRGYWVIEGRGKNAPGVWCLHDSDHLLISNIVIEAIIR